ncbi:heptaprenyl diphosphate synthase component 1 [Staphylococcus simulans]|uniref:heptaprenyl diphosphate synthase component 1 n=1 Tax=Staphylococcus simulans TaxID=1286 RepID=UPI0021D4273C|nr:heptaprenyl diphosphate synthase component 1 [Staphylococcus simulans]UXR31670.1 heptaprenyl pyrophosphate synthase subunit A [Staphylococcus simulans]
MDSTLSTLKNQIDRKLNGIHSHEPIQYNHQLAHVLDAQDILPDAKLACLAIDTSMSHLDSITSSHLSKNAILIGDLISAHFYTLTASINDSEYLEAMSNAIIKVNELKTALHYKTLSHDTIKDAVRYIETIFPAITIQHFNPNVELSNAKDSLIQYASENYPAYLKDYSETELEAIFNELRSNIK